MEKLINKILPNILYQNGFITDDKVYSFYSFCKPTEQDDWSDDMTQKIEEATKNHFLDIYNRAIVVDGIREKLKNKDSCYIDIGCSSGHMLEEIKVKYPWVEVIGADYYSAGLKKYHLNHKDIPLFQMDICNCNLDENLFDVISCLNVIEHVTDDAGALKNILRLLKPDGVAVITVPANPRLFDVYDEVVGHKRRYSLYEFKEKAIKAGFKIERINYFGFFHYPIFYCVKKLTKLYYQINQGKNKIKVYDKMKDVKRSVLNEKICSIEKAIGQYFRFPFGIRIYAVLKKI